jgi:hypothetical protein
MNASIALAALLLTAQTDDDLLATLARVGPNVYEPGSEAAKEAPGQIGRWLRKERERANFEDVQAWRKIDSRQAWEVFRDKRIAALKASLGTFPPLPATIPAHVSKTLPGDGFAIDNVVYESRPGLWVAANLYRPEPLPKSAPGILIIHSHHNPKTQGELQDMGMTWARLGCYVLIPDQLGHGERRQHPFNTDKDWPTPYKTSRQDYYFRYNLGVQLQLAGESLIGWMAYDMMAGVSLLLNKPGIDPERMILLGSVAAGGDSSAVTAALDPRIRCLVPFNFGGPQPETRFPLPEDAELAFNYMGGGSWESTRNIRHNASEGFMPWLIVGSIAPRALIHAHEFAWDEQRDPVWKRYQKIWGFYDAVDHLAWTKGRGSVKGKPPEATHCNNIGPEHRQSMYPALKKWFNIAIPEKEYRERRPSEELRCWTPELKEKLKPRPVHELAAEYWDKRAKAAAVNLKEVADLTRRSVGKPRTDSDETKNGVVRHALLSDADGLDVPLVFLEPAKWDGGVVLGVSLPGKQEFLKSHKAEISGLLKANVAVCLVDVPGTGETSFGTSRQRTSDNTSYSSSAQMLGANLMRLRLRGLTQAVNYLAERAQIANHKLRLGFWGESSAVANPADRKLEVPYDVDTVLTVADPLGSSLVLYASLLAKNDVRAILCRGGLVSYRSVFESPFVYVPHDSVEPPYAIGVEIGTIVGESLKNDTRQVRLERFVDGRNRLASPDTMETAFRSAANNRLTVRSEPSSADEVVRWFVKALE